MDGETKFHCLEVGLSGVLRMLMLIRRMGDICGEQSKGRTGWGVLLAAWIVGGEESSIMVVW
jgi:hypothetical protein